MDCQRLAMRFLVITAIAGITLAAGAQDPWQLAVEDLPPLDFPGLVMSRTAAQSRAINDVEGPCVIMSTAGMCTAGRIKHHLKRNLPRPESTVLVVG